LLHEIAELNNTFHGVKSTREIHSKWKGRASD